jgi:hypothetical protein
MSELSATSDRVDPDGLDPSPEYRPVSTLAVVGLLTGLASVLAFVHPLLWTVPAIGVVLSANALHRLGTAVPVQIGRRAALIGLTLSLLFGTSAVARWTIFRWQVRVETLQAGKQWFEALREGDPYKAHELTLDPDSRLKPDDDFGVRYSEPGKRKEIEEYVQEPTARLLLSLGPHARVHHYETKVAVDASTASVGHTYAVSVVQDGKTTSCFIQLYWTHSFDYANQDWQWKLSSAELMKQPPANWTAAANAQAR